MNERRAECGADESMFVHSEQRRNSQSRPFHENTEFTLLPPKPRTSGNTRLSSRASELPGLQVRGFCCPLQQRPSSGRTTHRVTPQSRAGGGGSLTLLTGRLESRETPATRSRTGGRPETPGGGAPSVCNHRDPVSETEKPTTPSEDRAALHAQPGATKVSELHLYLPSSLCDDEEQDAERAEMRTTAGDTSTQGSEIKTNSANSLHISQDETNAGPAHYSTSSEGISREDSEHS